MAAFQRGITGNLALDKAPMVTPMKESLDAGAGALGAGALSTGALVSPTTLATPLVAPPDQVIVFHRESSGGGGMDGTAAAGAD